MFMEFSWDWMLWCFKKVIFRICLSWWFHDTSTIFSSFFINNVLWCFYYIFMTLHVKTLFSDNVSNDVFDIFMIFSWYFYEWCFNDIFMTFRWHWILLQHLINVRRTFCAFMMFLLYFYDIFKNNVLMMYLWYLYDIFITMLF